MVEIVSQEEYLDKPKWIGKSLPRREARRFVQGKGEYSNNFTLPNAAYLCAYRSPFAHAKILEIDASEALKIPGVLAVFTGNDLRNSGLKYGRNTGDLYPLALDKVRYFGEPVAVVIAETPYIAEDGVSALNAEYEPLEPTLDAYESVKGEAPSIVHEELDTNVVFDKTFSYGKVEESFKDAYKVVKLDHLHVHRFISVPLEPTVFQAEYNRRGNDFYVIGSIKGIETYRRGIANALGVDQSSLHFRIPDVGGAFGIKDQAEWVTLVSWVARKIDRPVKWTSTQSEMLESSHHSEEEWWDAEMALDSDGKILAFKADCIHDQGAYNSLRGAANQMRNPVELYDIKNFEINIKVVLTNKVLCGANRGYAKLPHIFMLERLIDRAAKELEMDPTEIRLKNFITPDQMPYLTPNGAMYDGGDYPEIMRKAMKLFDYKGFRERQAQALKEGRYIGCGVALGMESNPSSETKEMLIDPKHDKTGNTEAAKIKVTPEGKVIVAAGDIPQGQGHESANAQIVSEIMGVPYDDVIVTRGYDSWRDASTPFSITASSRWMVMGTGAMKGAAEIVKEKILKVASHLLKAPVDNLKMEEGVIKDEIGGGSITLRELAEVVYSNTEKLPDDVDLSLETTYVYKASFNNAGARAIPDKDGKANFAVTYTYEVTFVEVEVDMKTFKISPTKICAIHDCGRQINPAIIESLTHGALANQVGAALWEKMEYDENGQLLTASLKDYLYPTAVELPNYDLDHLVTLSLFSPLGVRAVAEGAGTPTAATVSAVEDALKPFGIQLSESHVTPAMLYEILKGKK